MKLNKDGVILKIKGFSMKRLMFKIILLSLSSSLFPLEIKGKILNADSFYPLSGKTVILRSTTFDEPIIITTGDDGSFKFENLSEGFYQIEIKAIGFYPEKKTLTLKKNENLTFYLTPLPTASLGEVEIKGEREKIATSKTTIDRKTIQKSITGIGDPLDVLKKMPGVESISTGDLSTGTKLSIRGGQGFETIGFLDDAVVNFFYHRIIPDSVFIDDIIEEISLYKGVVPVEYGQLMSGMLNVKSISPPEGVHGKLNLGLLNTYLTVYGKTPDEKWSWVSGIRRTHYDLIFSLFIQESSMMKFTLPYYIDSHGKLEYRGNNDIISLIYLYSLEPATFTNLGLLTNTEGETINFKGNFKFQYFMSALKWKHIFNPYFFIEQNLGFELDQTETAIQVYSNEAFTMSSDNNLKYKFKATYYPIENIAIKTGGEMSYYPVLEFSNIIQGLYTNILTKQEEFTNFLESYARTNCLILSCFLSTEIEILEKKLLLTPGIRANYFQYVEKYSLDPRMTLEYRINEKHKVYTSAGYLSMLPADPLILSTLTENREEFQIPGIWHYIVGENSKFSEYWEISSEAYLKQYVNVLSRVSNVQIEYKTTDNKLYIYGIEILLKKNPGGTPLYGWLSASIRDNLTYVTEGRDPNQFSGFTISVDDNGNIVGDISTGYEYASPPLNEWFHFLTYKFNITLIWEFLKNFSLTLEGNYESGEYFTPIEGSTTCTIGTNIIYIPKYGKYLSEKMPDYHEINLKLEWTPKLFGLPCGLYIQVNNIYNNRRFYYKYNADYSEKEKIYYPIGIYGYGGVWIRW